MKKIAVVIACALTCISTQTWAMNKARYIELAKSTIQQVLPGNGSVDVSALIAQQKDMIDIAIAACEQYASENPRDAKLLRLAVKHADEMQKLSLDDIEEQWHDYGLPNSKGIKTDSYEHFAPTISLMDSIIHPATAIIVLNNFEKDGDRDSLMQVKDELSEVLEHLHYIP